MLENKEFILVPVDGSDASLRAADWAQKMASTLKIGVRLLSVLDLSQLDVYDGFYLTDEQLDKLKSHMREEILDEVATRFSPEINVEKLLVRGKASASILHAAQHAEITLVCIGKTGKSALKRILQGSVSRDVVNHVEKPCIVIP